MVFYPSINMVSKRIICSCFLRLTGYPQGCGSHPFSACQYYYISICPLLKNCDRLKVRQSITHFSKYVSRTKQILLPGSRLKCPVCLEGPLAFPLLLFLLNCYLCLSSFKRKAKSKCLFRRKREFLGQYQP